MGKWSAGAEGEVVTLVSFAAQVGNKCTLLRYLHHLLALALYQSASQEALFPLNFACGPLLLIGPLSLSCEAALLSF